MVRLGGRIFSCTPAFAWVTGCLYLIGATPTFGDVDTTVQLKIGGWDVSAYRIEKNLRKFLGSQPGSFNTMTDDIRRIWFERFLSQQVLIAWARAQGYESRSEVVDEVARMEHHMLTQASGPFYQHLFLSRLPSLPVIVQEGKNKSVIYNVQIIRFSCDAPELEEACAFFSSAPNDNSQWARWKKQGHCLYYEGEIGWPFESFPEILPFLHPNVVREFHRIDFADGDIEWFQVLSCHCEHSSYSDGPDAEKLLSMYVQQDYICQRKAAILRNAHFSFNWPSAENFMKAMTTNPSGDMSLHDADPADFILATREQGATKQLITAEEFIRFFNAQYVRELPETPAQLRELVANEVVDRFDYAEAIRSGVKETAQFAEDRTNYSAYQALDLFEIERIRPRLGIGAEIVRQYYNDHPQEFVVPEVVLGKIVFFHTSEAADTFAKELDSEPDARSVIETKTVALNRSSKLPGLETLPTLVFALRDQKRIGPIPSGSTFLVWVEEKVLKTFTISFAAAEAGIRRNLEDTKLASYEAGLAHQLASRFCIIDNVPYAKYGVHGDLVKPW